MLDRNGKWVQVKFPPNDSVYVIEAKADIIQCKTEKDFRRIIDSLKRENKRKAFTSELDVHSSSFNNRFSNSLRTISPLRMYFWHQRSLMSVCRSSLNCHGMFSSVKRRRKACKVSATETETLKLSVKPYIGILI